MKKLSKKSLSIVVVGTLVFLLAVAILVLSLVKIDTVSALNGYSYVNVYDLNSDDRIMVEAGDLDEALENTKFSVMKGILEGNTNGDLEFKGDITEDYIIGENFKPETDIVSTSTLYKLEFVFDKVKTVEVEGKKIAYNRAIVLVGDSSNEIGTLEIVFYEYEKIGIVGDTENTDPDVDDEDFEKQYYKIYTVTANANTTDLFNAVADIIEARQ